MRKKLFALLLATTLVLSSVINVSAANIEPEPKDDLYTMIDEVSGAEALAIAKDSDDNTVVIDLRSAADYAKAHIDGTISLSVCLSAAEGFAVTDELRTAFKAYAAENLQGKDVYLVCYVGTFCVNYASKWLQESGVAKDNIHRVLGGVWNDLDLKKANQATADTALSAAANGAIILDVRAEEVYQGGHLDKSLHQPVFTYKDGKNSVTNGKDDDLATNFIAFAKANKTLLESKELYILCNSGASGANAAHNLLKAAGIANNNVYTIKGGAKNEAIKNLFVENQSVSAKDAIAKIGSDDTVIIDLRTAENYAKGHLKGALSMPVFGANGVTSGSDELAQAFLASVQANADKFAGKNLYILCNSGAKGAAAATKLLMQAGYSNANIFTIAGGAKDETVKANLFYVSDAQALAVLNDSNYVIIDVRTAENYAKGHLKGSLSMPLFDANGVTNGEDALAQAFTASVQANADKLTGKTIYILCNSGARGAQNATALLKAAGYTNVFTIEGGAKNTSITNAFVSDSTNNGSDSGSTNTPETNKPEANKPETNKPETNKPGTNGSTASKNDTTATTPKTGDVSTMMVYSIAMLAAVAVIFANKKRLAK